MRYRLNRLAMIAFFAIFILILFSQTRGAGARPCTSFNPSSVGSTRGALVYNPAPCVKEYLTQGPLYNPTFTYSDSSLSFEIPTMTWSALGKAVFVPATHAKVAPDTTTYWFLRVPASSPAGRSRGSFVPSTSQASGRNELLEYVVVSNRSGIAWVRFPMPAQLRQAEWTDQSSNQPNVGGSALTEVVAQMGIGVQTDTSGDGFFYGAVVANAGGPPAPIFAGPNYGLAVIAQTTSSPTAQPGSIALVNGITVNAGAPDPLYTNGQVAVGFPNTTTGNPTTGQGLRGLFTAGTAGTLTDGGNGVLTFGNHTQDGYWTQIGGSGRISIDGVYNTLFSVLDEVQPSPASAIGCVTDAGGNVGCSGGLYGNADSLPFPSPRDSPTPPGPNPNPTPTAAPTQYAGPAVIAQKGPGAPIAQTGNVLINGTFGALQHNACAAPPGTTPSSGTPCEFTWTISSWSSGIGTTTVTVPASSVCNVTAIQPPIDGMKIITMWVTLSGTTLTVNAQVLDNSYDTSFSGNGNCN
jgi:hypothetical protein